MQGLQQKKNTVKLRVDISSIDISNKKIQLYNSNIDVSKTVDMLKKTFFIHK